MNYACTMIHDATELSAAFAAERRPWYGQAGGFLILSRRRLVAHGQALLWAAASTAVAFIVEPYTVVEELAMIHLLGVLVIALRSDVGSRSSRRSSHSFVHLLFVRFGCRSLSATATRPSRSW